MEKKKVAIIGGGLGGLSAAIRLASHGFEVDLFEQNKSLGGKANQISQNMFRFDSGPSLLTMPFVLKELFEFAGENIEEHLEIVPLDILCKYFYPDGTIITGFSDLNKFGDELEVKTTDNKSALTNYLNYVKKIYELTSDLFLFNQFLSSKVLFKIKSLQALLQLKNIDPFRTMHQANSKFFKDEKTIQLFDRYATYNGSNPFSAPATLNIIQHVEYNLGGYIVKQGIYSIVETLVNIARKKGVNIFTEHRVEQIITDENKIKCLRIANSQNKFIQDYDVIISNADVNFTYKNLLKDESSKQAKRVAKQEPSSSALVFYWGINGDFPNLDVHNILFSNNYKKEFEYLVTKKIIPDDPTIYIYISSKFKKDDAPQECENWFVMINTPYINNNLSRTNLEELRKNIIHKINSTLGLDISEKIIFEKTMTPFDIERNTSSHRGSIYGISSNKKSAAFLRQRNKSNPYRGLYFCGGSAHPGGGIPLVLLSGKITAELIMKDFA